jgi:hypothetical protein
MSMQKLRFIDGIADRLSTVVELFWMLGSRGRWWAIPAFTILIVLSLLFVLVHAMPYVAPFIYTVF